MSLFVNDTMNSVAYNAHDRNRGLMSELLSGSAGRLQISSLVPSELTWAFLEGEIDIVLASPLLYGRRAADLVLLPGACLAATGATGEVMLRFNAGLGEIATLGHYGEANLDTMLAQVLLKEKYGMMPRLLRVTRPPDQVLAEVDALLFTNDDGMEADTSDQALDLIDEWFDMTLLPFVREVFLAWDVRVDQTLSTLVSQAGDVIDDQALKDVERRIQNEMNDTLTQYLPSHYRYRFTDDALEGLRVFFQLAFYHGLHRDIPDFRFFTPENGETELGR